MSHTNHRDLFLSAMKREMEFNHDTSRNTISNQNAYTQQLQTHCLSLEDRMNTASGHLIVIFALTIDFIKRKRAIRG